MFCVGDTVIYGTQGVCRISAIEENDFGGDSVEYYVLRPVYDVNSTVFVPVKNEKLVGKMRAVLSPEEIIGMIRSMPDEETIWIEDETERKQTYQEIIREGDRRKLVRLIKTLHFHGLEQQKKGRRLHQSDESALKQAEELLYNEFALVLKIRPEEVVPFITRQIDIEPPGQAVNDG